MKNKDYIIEKLIDYSVKNYQSKFLHCAAVISPRGDIISIGINNFKNGLSIHAEVNAITKALSKLNSIENFDIISLRHNFSKNLKSAFPCYCCKNLIEKYKLRKLYFSNENGNIEKKFTNELIYTYYTRYQRDTGILCNPYND